MSSTSADVPAAVVLQSLQERLARIYPQADATLPQRLQVVLQRHQSSGSSSPNASRGWDEQEVVLITYGDQLRRSGSTPLAALNDFLLEQDGQALLSTIHILPFCPYSSDDGFSVIDYLQVDPALGTWEDVATLDEQFDLMFDLVLNHCSSQSEWFAKYLAGEAPYDTFFTEADPTADHSEVVRPRSLPLLTEVETSRGPRHVWTTFSADQVDLNYASPDVLLTMLDVLLEYARRGAKIIRLDAIAFLWKTLGTPCVHLPETHEVVKLMRDALAITYPQTWLLTETNVPHQENISYFGQGDEAQIVYQFPLPPLLLDAFTHGDATYFNRWLANLAPPEPGTTFLNFTASHDGVGVRPLEGLVPDERVDSLVEAVRQRGGKVSTRRSGDRDVPYEMNITYVDALQPLPEQPMGNEAEHAQRFLASQAVMLSLQGIPAVYFHSLVGTQNDQAGVASSGVPRRINRHKFDWDELHTQITSDPLATNIYSGYQQLLTARRRIAAFHPDAPQESLPSDHAGVIAFRRTSLDRTGLDRTSLDRTSLDRKSLNKPQQVTVITNVTAEPIPLDLTIWNLTDGVKDLITNQAIPQAATYTLPPNTTAWLESVD